ncbi:DUF4960 domain-containing protein [Antarcticibacterium flavum]|uniref:DUF4960 domain-containing protein n=1 Tax=Antarcticibacterium flavum TaxID=2058175 RepID=A0A5B7X085_9FLAO|nr:MULTISPECIES: DUF4960 domain-containing protein [Antarcticibacterium]MCM4160952.1 hypothetical protein [Antarcticibacterium sp. W02-3]QCY68994.1 DUF4960 domain-containing protein [Antarcticibacterium flavum]
MRILDLKVVFKLPAILIGISIMMFSCDDSIDDSGFILDVPVNIESFSLHGEEGQIDQASGEITFIMPYNTNITGIVPTVELPGSATLTPSVDVPRDFTQEVTYTVVNGNLYKNYVVKVEVLKPILNFSINGVAGAINHTNRTINLLMPEGTNLSNLQPEIEISDGLTISPSSGTSIDFSEPVIFTINANDHTLEYTVNVTTPATGVKIGYLGVASNRSSISDPDEKAAADWLFSTFGEVEYISFEDVATGTNLSNFAVIWWHFDEAQDLPEIAYNPEVLNSLKNFRNEGGGLLLTTFAALLVDELGIVPAGHQPNNVFGDFGTGGFVDENNNWGISFRGHEEHPLFVGLETFENGKANFLEKGTFRQNHTAWWFLPEWGNYGNGEGWRNQTGGINLASESWDDNLDGRVAIAEFNGTEAQGNVIVIGFGAYDWYNETDADGNESQANAFLPNIKRLTENAIYYLGGGEEELGEEE